MRIERDQIWTAVAVGALVAAVAGGLWWPRLNEVRRLRGQIGQAMEQLDQGRLTGAKVAEMKVHSADLRQSMTMGRSLPAQEKMPEFLRELSDQMRKLEASDHEIQTQTVQPQKGRVALPVTIRFHAAFPSIHALIQRLESTRWLLRVGKIEIDQEENGSQPPQARLELWAYFSDTGLDHP